MTDVCFDYSTLGRMDKNMKIFMSLVHFSLKPEVKFNKIIRKYNSFIHLASLSCQLDKT